MNGNCLLKFVQMVANYDQHKTKQNSCLNLFCHTEQRPEFIVVCDIDNCLYYNDECCKAEKEHYLKLEKKLFEEFKDSKKKLLTLKDLKREYFSSRIGIHKYYRKPIEDIIRDDFNCVENYIEKNEELIEILTRIKYPKYCFTNAFPNKAEKILKKLEVEDCFKKVFCSIDDPKKVEQWITKPQKEAFEFVEKYLGIDKNETSIIFFDDSLENIIMAKEVGWIAYHVTKEEDIVTKLKQFENEYLKLFSPNPIPHNITITA